MLFQGKFTPRYSAQVGAAVVAFVVTWIVLPTSGESIVQLNQQDDYKFRVRMKKKNDKKDMHVILICRISFWFSQLSV